MPNTGGIFQLGPGRGRPSMAIGGPGLTPQRCDGIRRDCPGRSVSEEVLAGSGRCSSLGMFCARQTTPFPAELLRSLPLAPVPEGISCLVLRLCPDLPWSFGGAGSVSWAKFRLPPGHSGAPVHPSAPMGAMAPVTPLLSHPRSLFG